MDFHDLQTPASPFFSGLESPLFTSDEQQPPPPPPPSFEIQLSAPQNTPYWQTELSQEKSQTMKPSWTYLSLAVQPEPMDIIARSRKGEYMVSLFHYY